MVIGAGAKILGPIIGANTKIAPSAIIISDVADGKTMVAQTAREVSKISDLEYYI